MALADGISFIAASIGTVDFVLASSRSSFMTLAQAVTLGTLVDGQEVSYLAVDSPTTPTQREWGHGTFSAGTNTVSRDTVLGNNAGTTSKVSFSVAPTVSLTALAEDLPAFQVDQGYIFGLTLSPSGTISAQNKVLNIDIGMCADSTDAVLINLTTANFQKSLAGAWAAGTGSNGMGTSITVAASTWYYVYAIINAGVVDVYFDDNAIGAKAPAGTTAFRLIGCVLTDGSSNIQNFVQRDDEFIWNLTGGPILEVNNTTLSATTSSVTLNGVPPINVTAHLFLRVTYASSSDVVGLISYDLLGGAPPFTTTGYGVAVSSTSTLGSAQLHIPTKSGQVLSKSQNANATVYLNTEGYTFTRGRLSLTQ